MADEAESGSIETAVAELQKARHAAPELQNDGNNSQDESDGAQIAATEDRSHDSPPDQPEAVEADTEAKPDDAELASNIAAPAWFNAEEREAFNSLPPEAQASLARLAKSAQTHISQRQNEHQAAMRAAQEASAAAAQERQQLQSALQHYKHPLVTAYQHEFADLLQGRTDIFRLAQEPERWNRYQAFQQQFAALTQAEQEIAKRSDAEEQTRLQEFSAQRNAQLIEAMPELKDPAKFEKFDSEVTGYLRALNIPDDRIARIATSEIQIVHKAMKWDQAQKAKAQAPKQPQLQTMPGQTVVQSHVRAVPKVMRPGVPRDAGTGSDRIDAAKQQLRKTGSLDDAAKSIRLLLDRKRVSA